MVLLQQRSNSLLHDGLGLPMFCLILTVIGYLVGDDINFPVTQVPHADFTRKVTLSFNQLYLPAVDDEIGDGYLTLFDETPHLLPREGSSCEFLASHHPCDQLDEIQRHPIQRLLEMLFPQVALLLSHNLNHSLPILIHRNHQDGRNRLCLPYFVVHPVL